MYGVGRGVAKDDVEAVKWYRKAAEQGLADGQFFLGWMYEEGRGVAEDEVEAVKWYRKAARASRDGEFGLGNMYAEGRGGAKDEVEAYKWYLLAGAQGNDLAKKQIARIKGILTPQQRAEGRRRVQKWKPVAAE